jgi:hypothetical protein
MLGGGHAMAGSLPGCDQPSRAWGCKLLAVTLRLLSHWLFTCSALKRLWRCLQSLPAHIQLFDCLGRTLLNALFSPLFSPFLSSDINVCMRRLWRVLPPLPAPCLNGCLCLWPPSWIISCHLGSCAQLVPPMAVTHKRCCCWRWKAAGQACNACSLCIS